MVLLRFSALSLALLIAILVTGKDLLPLSLLPFLLLLWIAIEASVCYGKKITFEPIILGLVVVNCGWWLLSATWSVAPSATLVTYYIPVSFIAGYLLMSLWQSHSRNFIGYADIVIVLLGTLSGLYAISQIVIGDAPNSLMANKNNHAALLNLVSFIVYLKLLDRDIRPNNKVLFSLAFIIVSTAMFIVGSRGAVLAFIVSLGFVLAALRRHIVSKDYLYLIGLPILGFIAAAVLGEDYIASRIDTLTNIHEDEGLLSRFSIWEDSFKLIEWPHLLGYGFGSYWMLFPQVRDPLSTAFYFFAHNDFLQILIEVGLVGFVLFLGLFIYLSIRVIQLLMNKNLVFQDRLLIVTIAAGVLSILIHSFVTFNFYIPIIIFLIGLLIARFQFVYIEHSNSDAISFIPSSYFSNNGYVILILLLFLVTAQFSATFSASSLLIKDAHNDFAEGNIESGFNKLNYSRTLSPSLDIFHRERAEILTVALRDSWNDELFVMGQDSYGRCIDTNEYRVACYIGLATILQLHPEANKYFSRIEKLYKQALFVDSANPQALANLAAFYIGQNDLQSAYKLLQGTENYKW